jgi:predicted small lipoprotein YifL
MSVIVSSMKIIRHVLVVLALLSIALATTACPEKGPMEKAGEKVDDAIDKTKDAVKDPPK